MHRLAGGLVLAFHGCRRPVAERVLTGKSFRLSQNDYDWLGEGIYFWESNPKRGLEFAREKARRDRYRGPVSVVGAVVDLGLCLDLTTSAGIAQVRNSFESLRSTFEAAGRQMPANTELLRRLDCAVINNLHQLRVDRRDEAIQTVRGVFVEGGPAYVGGGFRSKTHIQIAVRDMKCIKGVFRVPRHVMTEI